MGGRKETAACFLKRRKALACGSRAAAPPRELAPAPVHTGYCLTQKAQFLAEKLPLPSRKNRRNGGNGLKLTRHNGRSGRHGVYNPRHNDRRFDLANSEHIDTEMAAKNIYWDCYRGYTTPGDRENADIPDFCFERIEQIYYTDQYGEYVNAQNERNLKNRHPERCRTAGDLLKNNKTCPEESIYQIGTMGESVSPKTLVRVAAEFYEEFEKRYGSHVHILDWALHLDEGTPHIHERHVFDCENRYGELCPQQEKALEKLGLQLPNPDRPKGRNNNRKQAFDAECRELLFEIAQRHGLHLDREPSYGGRGYLEKQDYIIARQKERIAEQEQELEDLTLKISDVEAVLKDAADAAYEKACRVVTDIVRDETQKADLASIREYREWVARPERGLKKDRRELAIKFVDAVWNKLASPADKKTVAAKVRAALKAADVKKDAVEQIQKKARTSVMEKLAQARKEADRKNRERRERMEPVRKKDMDMEL